VRCGQLGIPGDLDLACAGPWQSALQKTGFIITTVFAAFNGESYADKPNGPGHGRLHPSLNQSGT